MPRYYLLTRARTASGKLFPGTLIDSVQRSDFAALVASGERFYLAPNAIIEEAATRANAIRLRGGTAEEAEAVMIEAASRADIAADLDVTYANVRDAISSGASILLASNGVDRAAAGPLKVGGSFASELDLDSTGGVEKGMKAGVAAFTRTVDPAGACSLVFAATITATTDSVADRATAGAGAPRTWSGQKSSGAFDGGSLTFASGVAGDGSHRGGSITFDVNVKLSQQSAKLQLNCGADGNALQIYVQAGNVLAIENGAAAAGGISIAAGAGAVTVNGNAGVNIRGDAGAILALTGGVTRLSIPLNGLLLALTPAAGGRVSIAERLKKPSYTVVGLPATGEAGDEAFCSNDVGGAVPVFHDGTDWRRVTDRAVASVT